MRCESFRVSGYRSVRDTTLVLQEGVTLLIGANGSGKSNVIGAMELLGRVVDNRFAEALLRQGGLRPQIHAAANGADARTVVLEVRSMAQPSQLHEGDLYVNGYTVELEPSDDGEALVRESTLVHNISKYDNAFEVIGSLATRSTLRERADASNGMSVEDHIVALASGIRVFHVDDTSPAAPALQPRDAADDLALHEDAGNLAAVLLRYRTSDRARYDRIVRAVRVIAPFFDDFVLEPNDGLVQLRWQQVGLDRVFHGRFLSSGTLRFISLATVLLQDRRPGVIVLDEPELGLHPAAIAQLAELMRLAADHVQVVAATQSVPLLDLFGVDDVALVERSGGETRVRRPDLAGLEPWLDDYTTGELWEMTILGGQPGEDGAVRPDKAAS